MKTRFAVLLTAASLLMTAAAYAKVEPQRHYSEIAKRLAAMLPRYHVLQQPLNNEISQRAWTNIVTYYDFDHSVFLESDLEKLAQHEKTIDDELKRGDVSFGYDIYNLYCARLAERIDFATNLLAKGEWNFSDDETYRVKRKDAPWPKTKEEAEDHWRRRMENEVLVQKIARELDAEDASKEVAEESSKELTEDEDGVEIDPKLTPEQNLIKKYKQYITVLTEPDEENVMQQYMSAVTRAYDPHTDYFSPTSKEDFDMEMNLSLFGIGAVLSMDEGALKITEIVPGTPIDLDGRIKEGDKIVGVQQGDGEMEDIMWQPIKKTIRKIRGEKGTKVTLEIQPRSDPNGPTRRVELIRDKIKLEDQATTGKVHTVIRDGVETKIGYIYLPSFYETMDKRPGDPDYRSCANDVATYIAEFNAQDVAGLVLDLRDNGGGSLKEAVLLSALFVHGGPVVQIRDLRVVQPLTIPINRQAAFRKPMVVLVNHASASASEIVAGHLRDTGRAIILGDHTTHGKGTVQSVMGLGPEQYGSMKITTARFYRINGRSTQGKGVASDIVLPSLLDELDIGEDKLTYSLPFSKIRKLDYAPCWNMTNYIPALAQHSAERLAANERYQNHLKNVGRMKELSEREDVPLEYEARKAMMREDRAASDLENGGKEKAKDDKNDKNKPSRLHRNRLRDDDVILNESYEILTDLVEMNGDAELPPSRIDWFNAILGL